MSLSTSHHAVQATSGWTHQWVLPSLFLPPFNHSKDIHLASPPARLRAGLGKHSKQGGLGPPLSFLDERGRPETRIQVPGHDTVRVVSDDKAIEGLMG